MGIRGVMVRMVRGEAAGDDLPGRGQYGVNEACPAVDGFDPGRQ